MRISDWSSDVCSSDLRWYFCAEHAAEYNKNWDYFQGLNAEEAAKREADARRDAGGFRDSGFYGWGGPGGGRRSRDAMRARDVLEPDSDADFEAVTKSWRSPAKVKQPAVQPGAANAPVRL